MEKSSASQNAPWCTPLFHAKGWTIKFHLKQNPTYLASSSLWKLSGIPSLCLSLFCSEKKKRIQFWSIQECKNEKKNLPIPVFLLFWRNHTSRCPAFSATSQPHTSSTGCFFKALCKAGRTMANAKAKGVATSQKWINFWSKVLRYWHSKNLLETPTKNLSRCLLVFYMTPFDFDSNVDVTFYLLIFCFWTRGNKSIKGCTRTVALASAAMPSKVRSSALQMSVKV